MTYDDGVRELLQRMGLPYTRENYINVAFLGNPPEEPLDAELEMELPSDLRQHDDEDDDVDDDETLTTEQLGELAIETIRQMTPEQKATVRQALEKSLQPRQNVLTLSATDHEFLHDVGIAREEK